MAELPRPTPPQLVLVAALDRDRAIGREGGLPWSLPGDLQRFRRLTWGHTLLMGRGTWESLPGPLEGRRSLVLSRQEAWCPQGAERVGSLEEALQRCRGELLWCIGGASVYRACLPLAARMELTRVEAAGAQGDRFFPRWGGDWIRTDLQDAPADPLASHAYRWERWERRAP